MLYVMYNPWPSPSSRRKLMGVVGSGFDNGEVGRYAALHRLALPCLHLCRLQRGGISPRSVLKRS